MPVLRPGSFEPVDGGEGRVCRGAGGSQEFNDGLKRRTHIQVQAHNISLYLYFSML